MATFNAELSKTFNPLKDNIAVVVKEFTLKRRADKFQRYSEPYIVSIAIDSEGLNNPKIDFNILPFPNVRKGDTLTMEGQGHLIYGPKNPGDFLAYSVLFMESDKDIVELGKTISEVVSSEAVNIGAKALIKAVPTYGTAATVILKLTELISRLMQKNKDDELFRRSGTIFRGTTPAYDILRTYKGTNDFIESHISIIPLKASNGMGKDTVSINL